ncbi:hypothetical protein EVAR_89798_1 [Eumeta japonica]|uniref:Uncharacterized protein n=1 Tax=Eumeta variegata TaxID=151549 RepID=A0A4C2A0D7_EUMVA|nr:hypothetical protein EVAR_89798_1 [Eumeta japonica]
MILYNSVHADEVGTSSCSQWARVDEPFENKWSPLSNPRVVTSPLPAFGKERRESNGEEQIRLVESKGERATGTLTHLTKHNSGRCCFTSAFYGMGFITTVKQNKEYVALGYCRSLKGEVPLSEIKGLRYTLVVG